MFDKLISKMAAPAIVLAVIIFGGALSGIDCTLTFFVGIAAAVAITVISKVR